MNAARRTPAMPATRKYTITEHLLFPACNYDAEKLNVLLKGKTVLITGASYGIGECLARALATTGAHLLLVARTQDKLEALKRELEQPRCKVSIYATDLTRPEEVQQLADKLRMLPMGVDIVVNNAGKSIRRSIHESLDRYHDATRTMGVNYLGPVQLLLALIPSLKNNKGHVINVSAMNVMLAPAPYWAVYQASKTAFDQWLRCVAPELKICGVACTSIYLPLVRTRMIAPTRGYDRMPAMSPEHVAAIACKYMTTRRRSYAPWWAIFPRIGSALFGRMWEAIIIHYLKRGKTIC